MIENLKKMASQLERVCFAADLEDVWGQLNTLIDSTPDEMSSAFDKLLSDFMNGQQDLWNALGDAPREPKKLKMYLNMGSIGSLPRAKELRSNITAFKREFKKVVDIYEKAI